TVPASEIFTSLQTGAIDAAEWVGPYNDVSLGLHRVAKYYYYPGWHEPGPMIQCIINRDAWNSLPEDLQEIVRVSCQAANLDMQSEYMHGNARALEQLKQDPDVQILPLPDDVLSLLQGLTAEVMSELVARDPWSARMQQSFEAFQRVSQPNQAISEQAYLNARTVSVK
ncbi:MAG: ABC transporter substrate-binding protein, partial [Woeseiaceae bacterium]